MTQLKHPPTPVPTVDCIVELPGERIVLVRRKKPPLGWALPGGFVEQGEALHQACVREVQEETGLSVDLSEQFFTYSDPARDPRRHTITTVYIGWAEGTPKGGDDAAEARAFALAEIPKDLCFDHSTIIEDYLGYKRAGKRRKI